MLTLTPTQIQADQMATAIREANNHVNDTERKRDEAKKAADKALLALGTANAAIQKARGKDAKSKAFNKAKKAQNESAKANEELEAANDAYKAALEAFNSLKAAAFKQTVVSFTRDDVEMPEAGKKRKVSELSLGGEEEGTSSSKPTRPLCDAHRGKSAREYEQKVRAFDEAKNEWRNFTALGLKKVVKNAKTNPTVEWHVIETYHPRRLMCAMFDTLKELTFHENWTYEDVLEHLRETYNNSDVGKTAGERYPQLTEAKTNHQMLALPMTRLPAIMGQVMSTCYHAAACKPEAKKDLDVAIASIMKLSIPDAMKQKMVEELKNPHPSKPDPKKDLDVAIESIMKLPISEAMKQKMVEDLKRTEAEEEEKAEEEEGEEEDDEEEGEEEDDE